MGTRTVMNRAVGLFATAMMPIAAIPATIDDLAWLSGCWAAANQEAGSGEPWMPPAGGPMFSVSRSVRDGKTVAFEFMRIVEQEDGGLELIASPSGQNTTSFTMLSVDDTEVIFENPDHDFPQRIIYRLTSEEILVGRIEGTINGIEKAVDFPMEKISCETKQTG